VPGPHGHPHWRNRAPGLFSTGLWRDQYCPVADSLLEQVKYVTLAVDEIDEAFVKLVFNPPWDPSMMSEDAREIMGASGAAMPF